MAKKIELTKDGKTLPFSAPDVEFMKTNGWKEAKETPKETPQTKGKK